MAELKSWYNVELRRIDADELREVLSKSGTKYETSEAGELIHFEICCTADRAKSINELLQTICNR